MKNSSDPKGNRSHRQVLNFVIDSQVKNMANLRVLQKGQYLKCDPNKSWSITATEICMLTVFAVVPCNSILSSLFIYPTNARLDCSKRMLKFSLKVLLHVSV